MCVLREWAHDFVFAAGRIAPSECARLSRFTAAHIHSHLRFVDRTRGGKPPGTAIRITGLSDHMIYERVDDDGAADFSKKLGVKRTCEKVKLPRVAVGRPVGGIRKKLQSGPCSDKEGITVRDGLCLSVCRSPRNIHI